MFTYASNSSPLSHGAHMSEPASSLSESGRGEKSDMTSGLPEEVPDCDTVGYFFVFIRGNAHADAEEIYRLCRKLCRAGLFQEGGFLCIGRRFA